MSPMQTPRQQWWPYGAPAGLGAWGRQTDERLSRSEDALEEQASLGQEIETLRDRVKKLEEVPQTKGVALRENQNARLVLWLIIAAVSLAVTGKLPDLSSLLGK